MMAEPMAWYLSRVSESMRSKALGIYSALRDLSLKQRRVHEGKRKHGVSTDEERVS